MLSLVLHMTQQQHISGLNSLRGFAALAVFCFHAVTLHREVWGAWFEPNNVSQAEDLGIFMFFKHEFLNGHLGVNLFFVLSGFLLVYRFHQRSESSFTTYAKRFFIKRLLRIWPLYFLIVGFGFLLFTHLPFGTTTVHSGWYYAFFLSNFDEIRVGAKDSINFLTATWTVSVEEQVYLGWTISILIFQRFFQRILWIFIPLLIVGSVVFRIQHSNDPILSYYHTFAVLQDFAMGLFFGRLFVHGNVASFIKQLSQSTLIILLLLVLLCFRCTIHFEPQLTQPIAYLLYSFYFGALVFLVGAVQWNTNRILRMLEHFGKRSYGFYLFHCIVLFYLAKSFYLFQWTSPTAFAVFFISAFLLTTLLSTISFRFIEQPFLQLIDKQHEHSSDTTQ